MKLHQNRLFIVLFIILGMMVLPGEGHKTSIVTTNYACEKATDCPSCVGSGLANASTTNFFGELSYQKCDAGKCQLSNACAVWSCGSTQPNCKSISQSILDNTVVKLNKNPFLYIFIIGLIIAYIMV